jgi:hypothetical protein
MAASSYLLLAIPYTFVSYFAMHRSSHLAYLQVDPRVRLNPFIVFVMRIEQFLGVVFLIWYGYMTVWYNPVILLIVAFFGTFILKAIEHTLRLQEWLGRLAFLG